MVAIRPVSIVSPSSCHPSSNARKFRYTLLSPLTFLLAKSPSSALQTILHVVFVPAQFKTRETKDSEGERTECLLPGALYSNCKVVLTPLTKGVEEQGREVWEDMESGVKDWNEREEKNLKLKLGESKENGKSGGEATTSLSS